MLQWVNLMRDQNVLLRVLIIVTAGDICDFVLQKFQKSKESRKVEWESSNGRKESEWSTMRGSITFEGVSDFADFAIKLSEVYPYVATAAKSNIAAICYMADLLLDKKKSLGDNGAEAVATSFSTWMEDREDPNLKALIMLAADHCKVPNFNVFKQFVTNALSFFKNVYVFTQLAILMQKGL